MLLIERICRISAHFITQRSTNSFRLSNLSTYSDLLSWDLSARNSFLSSSVGSRPTRSIVTRRRNVSSSHTFDGAMRRLLSFASTRSSTHVFPSDLGYSKVRFFGITTTGTPTVIVSYRAITNDSPRWPLAAFPDGVMATDESLFDPYHTRSVTSLSVPSENRATATNCWVACSPSRSDVGGYRSTACNFGASLPAFGSSFAPAAIQRTRRSASSLSFSKRFPPVCGTAPTAF